mmetsp:Transcript_18288/g.38112  ORF Transcript_18288/g.38112 Transcript_18288/m.38112 type:complete len:475 (+) Transcript_18288:217-1641(+)
MASARNKNSTAPTSIPHSHSNSHSSLELKGFLEASVLSVFDLPYSDAIPNAVTFSVGRMTVSTGPPLARRKDRSSFRFANANDAASIKLVAPLRDLYRETLKVRVTYDDPDKCLETDLDVRQLRIHQQKWLILNLRKAGESKTTTTPNSNSNSNGNTKTIVKAAATGGSSFAEEDTSPTPTIRIKFKLSGPFRPEIAALVNVARAWFAIVDKIEGGISLPPLLSPSSSSLGKKLPKVNKNMLLIPIIPVLVVLVAASPLVVGVGAAALPLFLPIALLCVGILATTLLSGGVLYSSTKSGRYRVGNALTPLVETLLVSLPGQALVYDTGPRPTPVSVCRLVLPETIWAKLWISLVVDLIGSSSYLLPMAGEGFDLAWAPAQTILIMAMYDTTSPNLKYVSFLEEILPFTDVVPSACIGWACEFLPVIWKGHAEKNNINIDVGVDSDVTRAVTQLVTTAAMMARARNANDFENTAR